MLPIVPDANTGVITAFVSFFKSTTGGRAVRCDDDAHPTPTTITQTTCAQ